jgi:hypothetical protein
MSSASSNKTKSCENLTSGSVVELGDGRDEVLTGEQIDAILMRNDQVIVESGTNVTILIILSRKNWRKNAFFTQNTAGLFKDLIFEAFSCPNRRK